mgnify:CR=1 FL=1
MQNKDEVLKIISSIDVSVDDWDWILINEQIDNDYYKGLLDAYTCKHNSSGGSFDEEFKEELYSLISHFK